MGNLRQLIYATDRPEPELANAFIPHDCVYGARVVTRSGKTTHGTSGLPESWEAKKLNGGGGSTVMGRMMHVFYFYLVLSRLVGVFKGVPPPSYFFESEL